MTRLNKFFIKKPVTIWTELSVWAGILGALACVVYGSWILVIIFVCSTVVSYSNIENDYVTVDVKSEKQGNHDLYEVKDYVNGKERLTYVIADSYDEVNLYCKFNDLTPGEITILGKANFFE